MKKTLIFSLLLTLLFSCTASPDQQQKVNELIQNASKAFVPDTRVAICDIHSTIDGSTVTLTGYTSTPPLLGVLNDLLENEDYTVVNNVEILPSIALEKKYGVVNLSVITMRAAPSYSSETLTQALLGQPIKIYQKDGWYRIQTPDDYLGWTHRSSIVPMTKSELDDWNAAKKVVVMSTYAFSHEAPTALSARVTDLVAGNRLRFLGKEKGYYKVAYPDHKVAYVSFVDALLEEDWKSTLKQTASSIIETAHSLMGVPYLWGGTSTKSVDCSGFVKTAFFLHGIILPRDASQMAYVGEHLDIKSDFSNLKPGDLLFFGRKATKEKKARVIHVGLYLGNKRFIHAQGHVFVSSFDPADPKYDAYNLHRLLWSTRVLDYIGQPGIQNITTNPYYAVTPQKK